MANNDDWNTLGADETWSTMLRRTNVILQPCVWKQAIKIAEMEMT